MGCPICLQILQLGEGLCSARRCGTKPHLPVNLLKLRHARHECLPSPGTVCQQNCRRFDSNLLMHWSQNKDQKHSTIRQLMLNSYEIVIDAYLLARPPGGKMDQESCSWHLLQEWERCSRHACVVGAHAALTKLRAVIATAECRQQSSK